MTNDDRRRVIVDQPGMIHLVSKEYLQIWGTDVYVNRRFFKGYTYFLCFFGFIGYLSVRFIEADFLLWTLLLANWWTLFVYVFAPVIAILTGVGLIKRYRSRRKRQHKAMMERVQKELESRGGD